MTMPPPPPQRPGRPPASGPQRPGQPPAAGQPPASGPQRPSRPPAPGQPFAPGSPPAPGQPQRPEQFGVPPGKFRPTQSPPHEPRRREIGSDPALERPKRRTWLPWLLGSVGAAAVLALVIALVVASFSAPNPIEAGQSAAPIADEPPDAIPTSTLATATPVEPAPGSQIPISMDVSFPSGMTFVLPSATGWLQSASERQPDAVILEHAASGAYIEMLETTQQASTYTDKDLTESFLNRAADNFTGSASNVGPPGSWYVSGGGYQLELLSQRVEWPTSSSVALVISRMMPGAASTIQIYVIAEAAEVDNPDSILWQKLNELTFTVP